MTDLKQKLLSPTSPRRVHKSAHELIATVRRALKLLGATYDRGNINSLFYPLLVNFSLLFRIGVTLHLIFTVDIAWTLFSTDGNYVWFFFWFFAWMCHTFVLCSDADVALNEIHSIHSSQLPRFIAIVSKKLKIILFGYLNFLIFSEIEIYFFFPWTPSFLFSTLTQLIQNFWIFNSVTAAIIVFVIRCQVVVALVRRVQNDLIAVVPKSCRLQPTWPSDDDTMRSWALPPLQTLTRRYIAAINASQHVSRYYSKVLVLLSTMLMAPPLAVLVNLTSHRKLPTNVAFGMLQSCFALVLLFVLWTAAAMSHAFSALVPITARCFSGASAFTPLAETTEHVEARERVADARRANFFGPSAAAMIAPYDADVPPRPTSPPPSHQWTRCEFLAFAQVLTTLPNGFELYGFLVQRDNVMRFAYVLFYTFGAALLLAS